jgi:hypothetical protein
MIKNDSHFLLFEEGTNPLKHDYRLFRLTIHAITLRRVVTPNLERKDNVLKANEEPQMRIGAIFSVEVGAVLMHDF